MLTILFWTFKFSHRHRTYSYRTAIELKFGILRHVNAYKQLKNTIFRGLNYLIIQSFLDMINRELKY